MSEHKATIKWTHLRGDFLKGTYSREHQWVFDNGYIVPASPSPSIVPAPYSNSANVDPEEAFVAAIASCHMLTLLGIASKQGIDIASYEDSAVGVLTNNDLGKLWISRVMLRPRIEYAGDKRVAADVETRLHEAAHHECFIANSVKTSITVAAPNALR
jgi:organic hydroperoxide reductase OsmC/OhrA